jgi:hypothetical protein
MTVNKEIQSCRLNAEPFMEWVGGLIDFYTRATNTPQANMKKYAAK